MKKIWVFYLFCFNVLSFGQMLNKNYIWNDLETVNTNCKGSDCVNGFLYFTHSYHIGDDTIINNKTYGIVIDSVYAVQGDANVIISTTVVGFIREEVENKKVYFWDINSDNESVLYDFSLTKKDSIVIIPKKGNNYICQVRDTTINNFFGFNRFTIGFYLIIPNYSYFFDWIEGIGSTEGFLYSRLVYGKLLCVKDKNEMLYEGDTTYGCLYTGNLTPVGEVSEENGLKIFPDPAIDEVTIQQNQSPNTIEIFNLFGNKLAHFEPYQKIYTISLAGYKSGIYLIKVGSAIQKLMVQ